MASQMTVNSEKKLFQSFFFGSAIFLFWYQTRFTSHLQFDIIHSWLHAYCMTIWWDDLCLSLYTFEWFTFSISNTNTDQFGIFTCLMMVAKITIYCYACVSLCLLVIEIIAMNVPLGCRDIVFCLHCETSIYLCHPTWTDPPLYITQFMMSFPQHCFVQLYAHSQDSISVLSTCR